MACYVDLTFALLYDYISRWEKFETNERKDTWRGGATATYNPYVRQIYGFPWRTGKVLTAICLAIYGTVASAPVFLIPWFRSVLRVSFAIPLTVGVCWLFMVVGVRNRKRKRKRKWKGMCIMRSHVVQVITSHIYCRYRYIVDVYRV